MADKASLPVRSIENLPWDVRLTRAAFHLPWLDIRQVFAYIKEDNNLKTIPAVILTSSEAETGVVKSYRRQADCYLSKPMHFEAFHGLVKSIHDLWLTQARLPQQHKAVEPRKRGQIEGQA